MYGAPNPLRALQTQIFTKNQWKFFIENQTKDRNTIALYGHSTSNIELKNIREDGFSIYGYDTYYIVQITGIKY